MQLRDSESTLKEERGKQDSVMSRSPRKQSVSRRRELGQMLLKDLVRCGLKSAYLIECDEGPS